MGGKSTRVLIVDDDEKTRCLLRMLLSVGDIEVVGEAPDGLQAVPQAIAHEPDVVILDYMMPGQRGDKTASMLRKLFPRLRIVAFSSILDSKPGRADAWLAKQDVSRVLQLVRLASTGGTAVNNDK